METAYDGRQVVGMDLHRRRSVLVRMTEDGRRLGIAAGWIRERSGGPIRMLIAVRLPGLARMPPVSAKRAPARALRYPTETPQVRVPSMFPTRIPRIKRHSAAHGGTAAKWPGAATVLAAAAARALVSGLCAGRQ